MSTAITNTVTNDDPNQPFFAIGGLAETEIVETEPDTNKAIISNTINQRMLVFVLDDQGVIDKKVNDDVYFIDDSTMVVPDPSKQYLIFKLAFDFYKTYTV